MSIKKLAKGAFVLTCANIITRLIGFFYRIFMSKTIGAEGMGLYQLIMPIYMLVWSISSSGITTAVSKITAEECGRGNSTAAKKTLLCAVMLSSSTAALLSLAVFAFSKPIAANVLGDARTAPLLKILSLCFPFMACGSCIRGYFFGFQKHIYPACAQVAEQIIRVACVFLLYPFFFSKGMEYACAAAVTGVSAGEFFAFVLTLIFLKANGTAGKSHTVSEKSYLGAFTALLLVAMPLTLTKAASSLLSTMENILIPARLSLYSSSVNSLSLFGSLTGMAMPLIQFPSSVLIAVSSSLMPAISSASAQHNRRAVEKAVVKSLSFTSVMSFFCFGFFFLFAAPVCQIVYGRAELGDLLKKLSFLCPLIYTHITINGILNGIGEHNFIFKVSLVSSFINISAIYFLMPLIGINAYIVSSALGFFFSCAVGLKKSLKKEQLMHVIFQNFALPLSCAICAVNICRFTAEGFSLGFIISALLFSLIYVFLIFFSGAADVRSDFIKLKKMR